ncbi:TonB family protein [Ramlibacter sp.]|uniref:cell envelope integrity protein TolA n=1 Tax=Ramlibacter sp. TaxID=1917967 RepID=UPI0035AF2A44
MPDHFDRIEFAPPAPGGLIRGWGLAILAHGALVAALAWGVQWKREAAVATAEAELWAALPQQAAPREVLAPPPPPPPVVTPKVAPAPPAVPDPQIALERERKAREAREAAEAEQRERDRKRKLEAQRKQREEEQAKLAEARKREAEQKRREQEAQEKKLAQLRDENMKRIQGLAGASGAADARGTAQQSAGPSPGWAGRVQAKVRPNIVFTEEATGNPRAEVEVRLAPDGTIVGKRLVRSSGVKAWDEAVLRALDKTETLPRDTDGRVPTPVVIEFRPRG